MRKTGPVDRYVFQESKSFEFDSIKSAIDKAISIMKTPGQIAYEAFEQAKAIHDGRQFYLVYNNLPDWQMNWWESAAQAVIDNYINTKPK